MTIVEDRLKEITGSKTKIFLTNIEENIERNPAHETMITPTIKSIIVRKITAKVHTTIEKETIAVLIIIKVIGKATLAADTIITITNGIFQATSIVKVVK